MKIDLHIERLVLDGVALTPAEQRRLGPAIEAALAASAAPFAEDAATLRARSGAAPLLRAALPKGAAAGGGHDVLRIGEQVAASVCAHLAGRGR